MNKFTLPALVLVLLTIPQIVDAQQRGRGGRQQQNPIEMILLQADSLELALTGDQTSQLTVMQGQLDEANAPAQQAMAALFEQAAGGFDQSLREQIQPHRQAMRGNNETALLTVRTEVLTEDQWMVVGPFLEAMQARGRRGGRGGPPPPR